MMPVTMIATTNVLPRVEDRENLMVRMAGASLLADHNFRRLNALRVLPAAQDLSRAHPFQLDQLAGRRRGIGELFVGAPDRGSLVNPKLQVVTLREVGGDGRALDAGEL